MTYFHKKRKAKNHESTGVNKKIRNAHKFEADGIKWDSKLEYYMYGLLKQYKVEFSLKQKYVLQKSFRYQGILIRQITWTPDFVCHKQKIIIDAKGFQNDVFPVKFKLFLALMVKLGLSDYKVYLPKNQSECRNVMIDIVDIISGKIEIKSSIPLFEQIPV